MTCRYAHCGLPVATEFWCADHAAHIASATTSLDAEPTSEDH